ncbi:type II toxin-antitoxin system PemK/MazF family toxin [Sporolactobacillus shoreicorticis]|uniref:mRNA interferase n=1 Tax=Sporolactobacillus shoreicorticis TaxID=1923877 RepID=A0ABW5S6P6_9BACL|nr:type II toxin-antitoxin system PemK/MazF family toxin [Sporolactobacillus shoreicorticis]MCO7127797.1 type II toxin-antitoxin system PemK/MazF family toxin [Sporolactobacillus shoreicorticis]
MDELIKKGDIFIADLDPYIGSEQGGKRPVLIVQNNIGNKFGPTVIIAPITEQDKRNLPVHLYLKKGKYDLKEDSIALFEQIRTIDKQRLESKIDHLDDEDLNDVDEKVLKSFGIEK